MHYLKGKIFTNFILGDYTLFGRKDILAKINTSRPTDWRGDPYSVVY